MPSSCKATYPAWNAAQVDPPAGSGDAINGRALNFVIAHKLGHIEGEHPFWMAVLFPSMHFPFISKGYSRACEYTCDTIAADLTPQGAMAGLLVLSAGKKNTAVY